MANNKIRMTIEIAVNEETLREKGVNFDDVVSGIRFHEHDAIDGFEITTNIPGCDSSSDFFLAAGDVVGVEKIEEPVMIANDVDIRQFKEQLSDIYGYDVSDITEKKLTELYNDVQDRLAENDTYNAIYNDVVNEIVSAALKESPSIILKDADEQKFVERGVPDMQEKLAVDDAHLDWSIEVYSIKGSKDLFVLQIDEDPVEDDVLGAYIGHRISYDKIEEKLRELVGVTEVSPETIDSAVLDEYYFSPDKTTGMVYLSDVVAESGIELKDYICGYDSSFYYEAVIHGLTRVDAKASLDAQIKQADTVKDNVSDKTLGKVAEKER